MASRKPASDSNKMNVPMMLKTMPSKTVAALKWLVVPRTTCKVISAVSTINATPVTFAIPCTQRRRPCTKVNIQSIVAP